jgi:hypothetical protein
VSCSSPTYPQYTDGTNDGNDGCGCEVGDYEKPDELEAVSAEAVGGALPHTLSLTPI